MIKHKPIALLIIFIFMFQMLAHDPIYSFNEKNTSEKSKHLSSFENTSRYRISPVEKIGSQIKNINNEKKINPFVPNKVRSGKSTHSVPQNSLGTSGWNEGETVNVSYIYSSSNLMLLDISGYGACGIVPRAQVHYCMEFCGILYPKHMRKHVLMDHPDWPAKTDKTYYGVFPKPKAKPKGMPKVEVME